MKKGALGANRIMECPYDRKPFPSKGGGYADENAEKRYSGGERVTRALGKDDGRGGEGRRVPRQSVTCHVWASPWSRLLSRCVTKYLQAKTKKPTGCAKLNLEIDLVIEADS